jgi:hypothetical protein
MSSFAATKRRSQDGMPAEHDRAGPRTFAIICACLLAILLVEHTGRMERLGFTTHDDLTCDLSAADARTHGFGAAWNRAGEIARGQGRIGYYVSYFLAIAPYMVDGDAARALLITGVHFLSVAALCLFLGLYTGPPVALLCLTLVYALLPHWWRYYPIGAYPVLFHVPMLLFFVAAILQVLTLRWDLPGRTAWLLRAPSFLLLGLSLTAYEATAVLFAAILALALAREWHGASPARRRGVLTAAISTGGVFLAYTALYVGFRLLHPSTYEGNQFSAATVLNFRAVATAIAAYAESGLPLAQFYLQPAFITLFSTDSLAELGLWTFWFRSLTVLGIAKAILLVAAIICFLRDTRLTDGLRRRALLAGAAACALALIVPGPLAITVRYQQDPLSKAPHVAGYFSYLCLMAALACAFAVAARLLPRLGRMGRAAALVTVGAGFFLGASATQVANDAIVRSQESHYATWRLAKLFARSEAFAALPENAAIVAPTLWDEISAEWPYYEGYWQNYFAAHTGRRVRVVRHVTAAAAPAYYLEIQHARDLGRPILLFQELRREPGSPAAPIAESTLVLAGHDLKDAVLCYLAQPEGPGAQVSPDTPGGLAGQLHTPVLPPCRYRRGAYITRIPSPRLIAGTATVESARVAGAGKREGLAVP